MNSTFVTVLVKNEKCMNCAPYMEMCKQTSQKEYEKVSPQAQAHSSSVVRCTPVRREMHVAEPVTLIHLIVIIT